MENTVKGMMAIAQVERVRSERGEEGLRELEECYGKPLQFDYEAEVPARDYIRLVYCAFDVLEIHLREGESRDFAVGRFHFDNFSRAPFGKLLTQQEVCGNWKQALLNAPSFSSHMAENQRFITQDLGPKKLSIEWISSMLSIEHFRGWFCEWGYVCGIQPIITGKVLGPEEHQYYEIEWE